MKKDEEPIMDGPKRMQSDLKDMMLTKLPQFKLLEVEENNIYKWYWLLMPDAPPYNQGAYKMEMDFPLDYPFKPPRIHMNTKIYHPNVNERGQLCLPILETEHWKPTSRIEHVIQVLIATINAPQVDNPYRLDVTEEYVNDRKKFDKIASMWVTRYSEHRPTDEELAAIAKKKKKAAQKK